MALSCSSGQSIALSEHLDRQKVSFLVKIVNLYEFRFYTVGALSTPPEIGFRNSLKNSLIVNLSESPSIETQVQFRTQKPLFSFVSYKRDFNLDCAS